MNKTEQLANDAFTEAQAMFLAWCKETNLQTDVMELDEKFAAQWKKSNNPAVVLKLCVYWAGKRIGTVLVRKDLAHGTRIFAVPNGWRAA